VCRYAGEGNDGLLIVKFGGMETAEDGKTETNVEFVANRRQLGGKFGAQAKGARIDSAAGKAEY
jgi:hypothetical protein